MRRRQLKAASLLIVLLILGALPALVWRDPGVADWPVYDGLRCRKCSGSISINPDEPEECGCRACRIVTYNRRQHFRPAGIPDFGGDRAKWLAARNRALRVYPASDFYAR